VKTTKWGIYEELKTEEDIQAFVEAETDTDPHLLALGVASSARGMLAASRNTGIDPQAFSVLL
jgi:DNA-binding phage protein